MREIQLFLRLLAERALTARRESGIRVLDASDFKHWLWGEARRRFAMMRRRRSGR